MQRITDTLWDSYEGECIAAIKHAYEDNVLQEKYLWSNARGESRTQNYKCATEMRGRPLKICKNTFRKKRERKYAK